MTPEDYSERSIEIEGWPVHMTNYKLDRKCRCKADNASLGASLTRVEADTMEEAESKAIARATELLSRTRRHAV